MKKDVLIKIKGVYIVDDDRDEIELLTVGKFFKKDGKYCISYDESEATGYAGTRTTISVESANTVTMSRTGRLTSQLIIENSKRHQCHYDTGVGELMLGVSGHNIYSTLNDSGGDLQFSYALDINTSLTSENEVYINVKEC